jgi:hypothetical protein
VPAVARVVLMVVRVIVMVARMSMVGRWGCVGRLRVARRRKRDANACAHRW